MADADLENKIIAILFNIIRLLELSVAEFEKLIPKPVFLDADTERKRWRFEQGSPQILQVLMCVRVASGLRACVVLLANGQMTEIGVLLRTIDDFLAEITFMDEVTEKGIDNCTTEHKRFLEEYFFDNNRTTEEMLEDSVNPTRKVDFTKHRQKMQASEARLLGGDDPHHIKKTVKTIDDAWSGVVHGSYQSVMEMYGGESIETAHFEAGGTGARFSPYRHHIGLHVHHALNEFCKVAYNLGHNQLAHHLREMRREFEKSPAYTAR